MSFSRRLVDGIKRFRKTFGSVAQPAKLPASRAAFSVAAPPAVTAAKSLKQLLAFEDLDFVHSAYLSVLGRNPEAEGEDYYLKRLRRGITKAEILRQLRSSAEGQSRPESLPGLDRLLARRSTRARAWLTRQLSGLPVLSTVYGMFLQAPAQRIQEAMLPLPGYAQKDFHDLQRAMARRRGRR